MLNTITVVTNAVKNAAGTRSRYVDNANQSPPTITRILPPSARNIATSEEPTSGTAFTPNPKPSNQPYATPAATLTNPPNSAEIAPPVPARIPETPAIAAVTMSCHLRTVRMGLVLSGGVTRALENEALVGRFPWKQSIELYRFSARTRNA